MLVVDRIVNLFQHQGGLVDLLSYIFPSLFNFSVFILGSRHMKVFKSEKNFWRRQASKQFAPSPCFCAFMYHVPCSLVLCLALALPRQGKKTRDTCVALHVNFFTSLLSFSSLFLSLYKDVPLRSTVDAYASVLVFFSNVTDHHKVFWPIW